MKAGCLYRLTFPNGKVYIGITTQTLKARFAAHLALARSGRGRAVHNAIRKYGHEAVALDVLGNGPWSELVKMEAKAIEHHGSFGGGGYNLTRGGEGAVGVVLSPERRAQMAAVWRGRKHSQESLERMRAAQLARPQTQEEKEARAAAMRRPEVRAKLAEKARGMPQRAESIAKRASKNTGQKRTAETIERMRVAQLGKTATPETKAKIGAASAARRHDEATKARIAASMLAHRERQRQAKAAATA